ncbi:MAG: purine-nucleoside phosphorylase [Clostridiales bacterium]|nr:purine-nucleoside phosphorylase [Clostridiales bacterium]
MQNPYPTPHIDAKPEDFGKTVLMPGDPLRSKWIAEHFFEKPVLINNVRGVQGYTGFYKGFKLSVMASGMGMPSMGIYSYELFNIFDVDNIIRVGSAGAMSPQVKVRDIVLAQSAATDSNYAHQFKTEGTLAPTANFELLRIGASQAEKAGIAHHVGSVFTSDIFYSDQTTNINDPLSPIARWSQMGVLCVEMETAALYLNAARAGKKALSILTISDSLITGEATSAAERQTSFAQMIELALQTAVEIETSKSTR